MLIQVFIAIAITILSAAILKTQTPKVKPPIVSSASEVNRTVEAIAGVWKGQMNANVPGSPPGSIDWTMDCKRVALNSGVLRSISPCDRGLRPSMSRTCNALLCFRDQMQTDRIRPIRRTAQFHHWCDAKTIDFEPLQAGKMGKQVIETLKWHFDDDRTIYKTSEVKLADGTIMQFQFKGKRVS